MIGLLKSQLPLVFYLVGLAFAFMAVFGRPNYALWMLALLYPLRNVTDRLAAFPMGGDFLDILTVAVLIGSLLHRRTAKTSVKGTSPIHGIALTLIFYTYFSLWVGYFYLGYFDPLNTADPRLQDCKNFILLPLLYFITFNTLKDKKDILHLLYAILAGIFVVNFYTGKQVVDFRGIQSRVKIKGTFVFLGPNEVAAFINQYMMILIALFFSVKQKVLKGVLGFLIFSNLNCIIFLFSRAAYVATWLGLVFFGLIRKRILLIPLIAILIGWTVFLPPDVQQRITMTVTESGELESSAQTRIIVWEQSWELFLQNPAFGVGFHVFRELGKAAGDTHNIYFKILVEQGVVGLIIFLSVCLVFIKEGWRLYKNGDDELSKALGIGFVPCVIVMMVNNLFGNRWIHSSLSVYLWMFAAIVARLNTLTAPPPKKPNMPKSPAPWK